MREPLFTVFTPTYNRAKTLRRVLESLMCQTFKDFEWLIVDDGSSDGTEKVVRRWIDDSKIWFSIRYIRQEHGHKKKAVNRGVEEAKGELFLILDSDDACVPDALERLAHHWLNMPEREKAGFAGVTGLCVDQKGNIVGDSFPGHSYLDSDPLEIRYRYKVKGEKWGFVRTDILRQFPYPTDIEGHVPEGVVWDEIGRYYKSRFINEILRIYYSDPEGEVQITKTGDPARYAEGHLFWKYYVLSNNMGWFRYDPLSFFLDAVRLTRFWLHCTPTKRKWFWPESFFGKMFVVIMFPAGWLWWFRDKLIFR